MNNKRLMSTSLLAIGALLFAGCASSVTPSSSVPGSSVPTSTSEVPEEVSQGVTDTTIKIGNTASQTGGYEIVGAPFNAGLKAALEEVNEDGGIGGRTIEFITYDDASNASTGVAMTEKLVEEDEVFALVGHFGTWTVGPTVDYIQDVGIPMVYAATGINQLYFERSPGNPVMAVQPIYKTEGRILLARVFSETDLFGTVDKVGVLYSSEDAGLSIRAGIVSQAYDLGRVNDVVYQAGSGDYSAAVLALKTANVDAVILATNQGAIGGMINAMAAGALNVPMLTSYVSANGYYIPDASVTPERPLYVNAWVDITSEEAATEVEDYVATINAASFLNETEKALYGAGLNSFGIAGYIAGKIFIEGLNRMETAGEVLNWENYIAVMESAAIDIPMGGSIDFTGGKRWGIDELALIKYLNKAPEAYFGTFEVAKPVESLDEILA